MVDLGPVAVIIPSHNRRELVLQAVRSVLDQTYANLHCIVVDNGSTDGAPKALAALGDPRLSVLSLGKSCGAAAARNAGVAIAREPWVAFLDNDDVWAPTKIEFQMVALAAHPEARWSATSCVHVGPDMRVRSGAQLPGAPTAVSDYTLVAAPDLVRLLEDEQHIPAGGSSVLAWRELVIASGGFNLDVAGCEEWDLWVRMARKSPLAYVDQPLVAYRVWDGQTSTNVPAQIRSARALRARNFPESGPVPRSYLARWEKEAARRHVAGRRRISAAWSYVRAAWVGRNPGQLAYAAASAVSLSYTERRLRHIERSRCLPDGWEDAVEPWLATCRREPAGELALTVVNLRPDAAPRY